MNEDISPIRARRRDKIIALAERTFLQDGFRATSMEGVAQLAEISKVTLYGYFPNKEALFDAVANAVADRILEVVGRALDAPGATSWDKACDALKAKHRLIGDLVRVSPHAKEIFSAKDLISQARFAETDARIQARITEVLKPATGDDGSLARMLIAASQGIANAAATTDAMQEQIDQLFALAKGRSA